jgi:hypothetical protein
VLALPADDAEVALGHRIAVQAEPQHLSGGDNRRQRIAQLVGEHRQELIAVAVLRLQLLVLDHQLLALGLQLLVLHLDLLTPFEQLALHPPLLGNVASDLGDAYHGPAAVADR